MIMKRLSCILIAGVLVLLVAQLQAQDWPVPAEEADRSNPSDYTLEHVKQGKAVYTLNCKSCHGDPGKNNPLTLVPMPVDIASEKMQANSEGALFYKITRGKGVMPPFESTLSETERWNLVNFIMNYNADREQLLLDLPPLKARLLASVNEEMATVEILAEFEDKNQNFLPLLNTPVSISAKKAFGKLEIGQAVTNEQGRASYAIPENTMGDEEGYISIVISLTEDYDAPVVVLEKALVGSNKDVPAMIRKGVLWSTNKNVSLWVLLSYILAVAGAWAVIAYVVVQITRIKKQGRSI